MRRVLSKALEKISFEDQKKYSSQFAWFTKRVDQALESAGFKLVNLEGMLYDPGQAVTPLNLDDFDNDEQLFVIQMVEPTIIKEGIVIKTGTVLLGRAGA